jgi:hypothetical protein
LAVVVIVVGGVAPSVRAHGFGFLYLLVGALSFVVLDKSLFVASSDTTKPVVNAGDVTVAGLMRKWVSDSDI